jgi:hypothetical protein
MRPQATTVITEIASRQHSVVARAQLLGAGISAEQIRRRVRSGALLREHRGVYRVGHRAPSVEARHLAAVFACGEDALLSGRAAAHLFGLVTGPAPAPEVTTPRQPRVPSWCIVDASPGRTARSVSGSPSPPSCAR